MLVHACGSDRSDKINGWLGIAIFKPKINWQRIFKILSRSKQRLYFVNSSVKTNRLEQQIKEIVYSNESAEITPISNTNFVCFIVHFLLKNYEKHALIFQFKTKVW